MQQQVAVLQGVGLSTLDDLDDSARHVSVDLDLQIVFVRYEEAWVVVLQLARVEDEVYVDRWLSMVVQLACDARRARLRSEHAASRAADRGRTPARAYH